MSGKIEIYEYYNSFRIEVSVINSRTKAGELMVFGGGNINKDLEKAFAWFKAKGCVSIKLMPSCEDFIKHLNTPHAINL